MSLLHVNDTYKWWWGLREPVKLNLAAGTLMEDCWPLLQTVGKVF